MASVFWSVNLQWPARCTRQMLNGYLPIVPKKLHLTCPLRRNLKHEPKAVDDLNQGRYSLDETVE